MRQSDGIRLAEMKDLPEIQSVYQALIRDMESRGISIWDEIYPCAFFPGDIENRRLYLLTEGERILSAFALSAEDVGENAVEWPFPAGKAVYLDRLGVRLEEQGKGIGRRTLEMALEEAGRAGAESLRLFAEERNLPAIRLYEACGFTRARGVYRQRIDEETVLTEYGYEKPTE